MSLDRAQIYLGNQRYQEAANECRKVLASEPDDSYARALLAVCLMEMGQHVDATLEVQRAISSDPELAYPRYVHATILSEIGNNKAAEKEARAALEIAPEDEDNYGLLSMVLARQGKWKAALDAAEEGLRLDAEHPQCQHIRGLALGQLGRKAEAGEFITQSVRENPDSAVAHASLGWNQLQRHEPKEALESFKSALKIDPEFEWAREGLIEALRARYWIYRVLLSFMFWIGRFPPNAQWGISFGLYIGFRVLQSVTRQNPQLWPVLLPVVIVYGLFVFMLWTANPLFNLTLLSHPLGKLALTRQERQFSALFGATISWALIMPLLALLLRAPTFVAGVALALLAGVTFSWLDRIQNKHTKVGAALFVCLLLSGVNIALIVAQLMGNLD